MIKFEFEESQTPCLAFQENGFNTVTQKFAEKVKNGIFKGPEHSIFTSGQF